MVDINGRVFCDAKGVFTANVRVCVKAEDGELIAINMNGFYASGVAKTENGFIMGELE